MEKKNVLTEEKILEIGIEFSDDVCYSGEYGQQIFDKPMEDEGKPIEGVVYERYKNGHVQYYAYYKNGIANGISIEFYESGSLKSKCIMDRGTVNGEKIIWFEDGNLINEKKDLTEGEKIIFDKYEKLETKRHD